MTSPEGGSLTFRAADDETVRYFSDKLPIGVDRDGPYTFIYLLTQDVPIDCRAFLEWRAELFRSLPWAIRVICLSTSGWRFPLYQAAFDDQLAAPLRPIVVDDLRWYFEARRSSFKDTPERFDQAARAFSAPRFSALYRAWLERSHPVLETSMSATLADATARKTGQLECHVLAHRYLHLAHLVGTA